MGNKCEEKSLTSAWLSALLSDKAGPQAGIAAACDRNFCSRALEMVCRWMVAGDEAYVCVWEGEELPCLHLLKAFLPLFAEICNMRFWAMSHILCSSLSLPQLKE